MLVTVEISMLATPKAVPELRYLLRHHGYDVQLCASELLTNVVDHVGEGTPVTVRVARTGANHTRVEVTDPDPRALPVLVGPATATAESGRGLTLLDALALRWGVEQRADRKTVWCELEEETPNARLPVRGGGRSSRSTAG
ncbi:ATP-binding protein [Streptomyces sp. NPDC017230]|uniref:ATP-binding protein n=1 Tax=unclassified Streptomyces TaxID=2593676 RepID=UPI00379CD7C5